MELASSFVPPGRQCHLPSVHSKRGKGCSWYVPDDPQIMTLPPCYLPTFSTGALQCPQGSILYTLWNSKLQSLSSTGNKTHKVSSSCFPSQWLWGSVLFMLMQSHNLNQSPSPSLSPNLSLSLSLSSSLISMTRALYLHTIVIHFSPKSYLCTSYLTQCGLFSSLSCATCSMSY